MRIVTSYKEVYQDETRRVCKGSVALSLYCDLCCPRVRYVQCWTQVFQVRLCQHQVLLAVLDSKRWKRVSAIK